jgi:hypothetical protein
VWCNYHDSRGKNKGKLGDGYGFWGKRERGAKSVPEQYHKKNFRLSKPEKAPTLFRAGALLLMARRGRFELPTF